MHTLSTLDEFDWKLLAALQEDGRLTNQELGDRIGLSPSQCSRRRSRLEEEGFVLGYHARIDRLKTGYNLTVFIHVGMNSHTPDNAAHLKRLVNRLPQVEEAYSLTGDMDYQLKLNVRNLADLSEIINNDLLPDRAVQTVKSTIVLDTLKEGSGLPLSRT